jgi:hypothetical protein
MRYWQKSRLIFAKAHMKFVSSKNCRDYIVQPDDFIVQHRNTVVGTARGLIALLGLCGMISRIVPAVNIASTSSICGALMRR